MPFPTARRCAALTAALALGVGALVAVGAAVPAGSAAAAPRLDGYTAASSARERAIEAKFQTYPSATLARQLDKQLSARPAMVGTANDKRRVQQIVARLRSFGLQPHVSTYYVYMSRPKKISLKLISPVQFTASNKEKCRAVETDCKTS